MILVSNWSRTGGELEVEARSPRRPVAFTLSMQPPTATSGEEEGSSRPEVGDRGARIGRRAIFDAIPDLGAKTKSGTLDISMWLFSPFMTFIVNLLLLIIHQHNPPTPLHSSCGLQPPASPAASPAAPSPAAPTAPAPPRRGESGASNAVIDLTADSPDDGAVVFNPQPPRRAERRRRDPQEASNDVPTMPPTAPRRPRRTPPAGQTATSPIRAEGNGEGGDQREEIEVVWVGGVAPPRPPPPAPAPPRKTYAQRRQERLEVERKHLHKIGLQCTICMSKMTDPASTKCGHMFCHACISEWVGAKKGAWKPCPICKAKVNANQINRCYLPQFVTSET